MALTPTLRLASTHALESAARNARGATEVKQAELDRRIKKSEYIPDVGVWRSPT